jgi:hypothetical protein
MKLNHLLSFSFALILGGHLDAQSVVKNKNNTMPAQRTCGTGVAPLDFENQVQQWMSKMNQYTGKMAAVNYTIPVIIHIIHNGEALGVGANISNAQAISQITILNAEYQGMNSDSTLIPTVFKPVFAHSGISFCLAKTDPLGVPLTEIGVDRINRNTKGWSNGPYNSSYFDATIKPNSIWDPNQYLNIWCASLSGGLLGYATFPNPGTSGLAGLSPPYGSLTDDGVVILNTAFGNTGTAAAPFNKGRTATHEIGHWLGLRHIWGDSNCGSDFCNDTPPAQTSNSGCPTHPYKVGTCSGNTTGEMFMNYMDYVNDACMYMFSNDQKARMVAILNGSPMRINLTASTKCNTPAALDAGIANILIPANGLSTCVGNLTPQAILTNFGSTNLTSCTFNYSYNGGTNQTIPWTGNLATGASATITMPSTVIPVGNHTLTVFTTNPNGGTDGFGGNDTKISNFTVTTAPSGAALPFFEGFESTTFVPTGWQYTPANPPYSWLRSTACSGFGTSTACAKMDHYSSNNPINGQIDIMRTPAIDFSLANSTLKLYWEHAFCLYATGDKDSLIVEASTDCGGSWTRIFGNGGATYTTAPTKTSVFVPTAAQWKKDSVSLASYSGMNSIYLRFKSISDWGNNLYIDNINIKYNIINSVNSLSNPSVEFAVYPNPTNGEFTLNVNKPGDNSFVEIYNTLGQLVTKTQLRDLNNKINLGKEANGVYHLRVIQDGKSVYRTKVVKN